MGKGLSPLQKGILLLALNGSKGRYEGEDTYYFTTQAALQEKECPDPSEKSSISRAFRRLEERGLVERCRYGSQCCRHTWGIVLTKQGKETALDLKASGFKPRLPLVEHGRI
jgi:hypothetical protein